MAAQVLATEENLARARSCEGAHQIHRLTTYTCRKNKVNMMDIIVCEPCRTTLDMADKALEEMDGTCGSQPGGAAVSSSAAASSSQVLQDGGEDEDELEAAILASLREEDQDDEYEVHAAIEASLREDDQGTWSDDASTAESEPQAKQNTAESADEGLAAAIAASLQV